MITSIIVDDEPDCSETLSILLEKNCPQVQILATCGSGTEALKTIATRAPDLIFLDIEMPHMNGFQLLEKLPSIDSDIIFTTSYDQYAIKAIRFSAMDYLLKPIDREELKTAVEKVSRQHQPPLQQQLEILLQRLRQPPATKIAIPTMEGLQMISIDSIIACASDSNYTILYLKGRSRITASRTLKEIEEMLDGLAFHRVHHSSLVNINEIQKYVKGEGGYLIMSDGSSIDVSRSRKASLLAKLQSGKG